MLEQCLSPSDARRATDCLRKLGRHDLSRWALTGGLAGELHRWRGGDGRHVRELNDIDFVAGSFDDIPDTLAADFLFRHIHPLAPPGKTMLQAVDPESAVRIDLFRACGGTMNRAVALERPTGGLRLVSIEDLASRMARLALDLKAGVPTPDKHARDFLRVLELVDVTAVEEAWRDHRKPDHPASFAATAVMLQRLIVEREHLLVRPAYSTDTSEMCHRCVSTSHFKLAAPEIILDVLGYC